MTDFVALWQEQNYTLVLSPILQKKAEESRFNIQDFPV